MDLYGLQANKKPVSTPRFSFSTSTAGTSNSSNSDYSLLGSNNVLGFANFTLSGITQSMQAVDAKSINTNVQSSTASSDREKMSPYERELMLDATSDLKNDPLVGIKGMSGLFELMQIGSAYRMYLANYNSIVSSIATGLKWGLKKVGYTATKGVLSFESKLAQRGIFRFYRARCRTNGSQRIYARCSFKNHKRRCSQTSYL